jgi:hypothetical protein
MKKILSLICILYMITLIPASAQEKSGKNIAGFGATYVPYMKNGIYFDDPWDFFPNQEPSTFLRVFYARKLNKTLQMGTYMEAGQNNFTDQTGDSPHSFKKRVIGIDWVAKYPNKMVHMELGGFFGYSMIKANNWDKLNGVDFGMLAGPAYESRYFGISVLMKAGFSPHTSGDGIPEGVLLYTPGILFKVYGRF